MSVQRPPQDSPPPGWYPQAGAQRYWDGMQWTQHMAPLARSSGSNTWAVMSHLSVGGFIIPLLALAVSSSFRQRLRSSHATGGEFQL